VNTLTATAAIALAVAAFLLGRYGRGEWVAIRMNTRRLRRRWAEHRAEQRRDDRLDLFGPNVTKLHYRRRPRDRWTVKRRRTWADIHDVFPDDLPQREPQRVPDGPTLELAQLADAEAMEKLVDADLPHYRQQEQNQ